MSVKRQIAFNGIAHLLSKLIRIADQLLLVPIFLKSWGAAYYGEWLTLSIIPSVLAFADFGLGTAASNSIVLSYASGKRQECADWYETGFRVISASIIFGLILSAIIMLVAWHFGYLEKSLIEPIDAFWSVLLLMGGRLANFYNQLFDGFYRSKHKADISINMLTIEGLLKIGVGIGVLMMGYGIVAFSLCQFVIIVLFNVIYAYYAKSIMRELSEGRWNIAYAKDTFKKGMAYFVSPLWQSIYFQGSTFIVRIVMGPEAVAVFNTLRTMTRSINQMYSVVNGAIMPELQIAIGERKETLSRRLFINGVRLSFIVSIAGVIIMSLLGLPIYNWWTQNQLKVSSNAWFILLIGIMFNAIWWTASVVFRAKNEPYHFSVYCIVSAVISVIFTYLLALPYGMLGAVIGYMSLDVMMAFLVLPTACRMINISLADLVIIK